MLQHLSYHGCLGPAIDAIFKARPVEHERTSDVPSTAASASSKIAAASWKGHGREGQGAQGEEVGGRDMGRTGPFVAHPARAREFARFVDSLCRDVGA